MTRHDPFRRAFTLVELLVAMGIIVVLALLVMMGVGQYIGRAQSMQCAGKLRQIAALMNIYASEHNGWYPHDAYNEGYRGGGTVWAPEHYLLAYDGFTKGADGHIIEEDQPASNSLFRCPGEHAERDMQGNIWFQSHYGFNRCLVHYTQDYMVSQNGQSFSSSNPYRRPVQTIGNPSKVFLVADSKSRYSVSPSGGSGNTMAFRHGSSETCNVAFVDGHVEVLPRAAKDHTVGGPAALGWDQWIEWGGTRLAPDSPRY